MNYEYGALSTAILLVLLMFVDTAPIWLKLAKSFINDEDMDWRSCGSFLFNDMFSWRPDGSDLALLYLGWVLIILIGSFIWPIALVLGILYSILWVLRLAKRVDKSSKNADKNQKE